MKYHFGVDDIKDIIRGIGKGVMSLALVLLFGIILFSGLGLVSDIGWADRSAYLDGYQEGFTSNQFDGNCGANKSTSLQAYMHHWDEDAPARMAVIIEGWEDGVFACNELAVTGIDQLSPLFEYVHPTRGSELHSSVFVLSILLTSVFAAGAMAFYGVKARDYLTGRGLIDDWIRHRKIIEIIDYLETNQSKDMSAIAQEGTSSAKYIRRLKEISNYKMFMFIGLPIYSGWVAAWGGSGSLCFDAIIVGVTAWVFILFAVMMTIDLLGGFLRRATLVQLASALAKLWRVSRLYLVILFIADFSFHI